MDYEAPEAPQEEQSQEAPQTPALDPRQALELAAQHFGTTPDYLEGAVRLQDENRRVAEEVRRRQRELELREARLEALEQSRPRYTPPEQEYQQVDPMLRPLVDRLGNLERMYQEEREERTRAQEAQRRGAELNRHFQAVMQSVPTQQRIDQMRFFDAMAELWPEGPPPGITPDRAVGITARYIGLNMNGGAPLGALYSNGSPPQAYNPRDRRAAVVIPTGPSAEGQGAAVDYSPQQRPGESREQYEARLKRAIEELGIRGLTDGQRVASS